MNPKSDIPIDEADSFEKELQRLQPAKPSAEFLDRLALALPDAQHSQKPITPSPASRLPWGTLLRWLTPATALATIILVTSLTWPRNSPSTSPRRQVPAPTTSARLKADNVEIDQRLVASFDAVARLPDGEPVRFRCREWTDEVVFHDSTRGITIERRSPRLEVTPVSLETY